MPFLRCPFAEPQSTLERFLVNSSMRVTRTRTRHVSTCPPDLHSILLLTQSQHIMLGPVVSLRHSHRSYQAGIRGALSGS